MKKLLFSVAILAVAASCSKNEAPDVATSASNAIDFATLNNLAKSANDDDQLYRVYATQTGVTGAWYINGDYSIADGTALQNTYYWPADETSLNFYAYAPYTAATVSAVAAESISIEYTVPTTADEDFTIAAPILAQTANTVALKFAHQLSKATVEVVLAKDLVDAGYKLTMDAKVEAADAIGTEGVDGYVPAVAAQDAATVELSVFGTTATYNVMAQSVTYPAGLPTALTSYTKDYADNYFIFMPQSAEDCTISVTGVTITDPSEKVIAQSVALGTYTITEDDLANGFEQNYNYAITLTIDEKSITTDGPIFGDAIVFSAETLSWTTYEDGLPLGSDNQDVD
ncbi:MAG: fimbrillin family protein [Rikenellaceae bacterium]